MEKKFLIFIQSLIDDREELEEKIYFSGYFRILYFLLVLIISFSYFKVLIKIFEEKSIINISNNSFEIPRTLCVFIEMVFVYISCLSNEKYKLNKRMRNKIIEIIFILLAILLIIFFSKTWKHWILFLSVIGSIMGYRYLVVHNLKIQISKMNIENNDLKIKLNDNLREKTREIFIKKVKNSYNNIKEEDYKELKENIKKIYNEQKLENFIKKLSIFIPVVSFTGKFLYDYFEKNKNILFEKILTFNNIKNWIMGFKLQDILNITFFLITFFIVAHFIYKIFELRFRDKRERINEVAECIEILHNDNNH